MVPLLPMPLVPRLLSVLTMARIEAVFVPLCPAWLGVEA